jgi:hypothetical protein
MVLLTELISINGILPTDNAVSINIDDQLIEEFIITESAINIDEQ